MTAAVPASAPVDLPAQGLMLLCRARRRLCALPLPSLVETMRPLPLVPLSDVPSFVCGVARIRGSSVPVVDVGALLGAPEEPALTRLVTLKVGDRRVALAFEEVLTVHMLPLGPSTDLPPLLQGAGQGAVAAVGALDAELLLVLQCARLIPEAVWRALEADRHQ